MVLFMNQQPKNLSQRTNHMRQKYLPQEGRDHCCRCDEVPQDIMMLACGHGICLGCASVILNSGNASGVRCSECGKWTELEEQIIIELRTAMNGISQNTVKNSRLRNPASEKYYRHSIDNNYSNFTGGQRRQDRGMVTLKASRMHVRHSSQIEQFCRFHPQYELIYICLQCGDSIVCPECVIHGGHRGHEVQTLKKYLASIHLSLNSKLQELDVTVDSLMATAEQAKKQLIQKNEQISLLKSAAMRKYNRIREEIANEEMEIMTECENLLESYSRQYKDIEEWVRRDLQKIQNNKQEIDQILFPKNQGLNQRSTELQAVLHYLKKQKQIQHTPQVNQLSSENLHGLDEGYQQNVSLLTNRIDSIRLSKQDSEKQSWQGYTGAFANSEILAESKVSNQQYKSPGTQNNGRNQISPQYLVNNGARKGTHDRRQRKSIRQEKENSNSLVQSRNSKAAKMRESGMRKKTVEEQNYIVF